MRSIAVVGTRRPTAIQQERCRAVVAAALAEGWEIVTGGAPGIDAAAITAATGAGQARRVILVLPWANFGNWRDRQLRRVIFDREVHGDWLATAKRLHPAPGRVSPGAWSLLARDVGIVAMAEMVAAFPQGSARSGGTGFSCRVAESFGKPVYADLGWASDEGVQRQVLEAIRAGGAAGAAR